MSLKNKVCNIPRCQNSKCIVIHRACSAQFIIENGLIICIQMQFHVEVLLILFR